MKHINYRLGELFCGPGGIGLGAKNAGLKTDKYNYSISHAWATDYHKDSCETYRNNICPKNPNLVICEDIRKLDLQLLAKISSIDALAFGFPCNDYSIVGEQRGINGEFGPLYRYGIEALKLFRPKWFIAENVGGLISSNNGGTFNKILDELKSTGYQVTPHLYKFEQYGVPQARHRIIIVGFRNDINCSFSVPSPIPYQDIDVSCRNAIENPPIQNTAPNNEVTRQSNTVVERLKHIKPGQNAFDAILPDHLKLNVKGARISQIYKRLDPSKPSYTVTGSGGGGTHVYHWNENRALTNRERARLQTFPDDFVFYGSKESVRKQIGMAVPPKAARVIFDAILLTMAGIEYLSIQNNYKTENSKIYTDLNADRHKQLTIFHDKDELTNSVAINKRMAKQKPTVKQDKENLTNFINEVMLSRYPDMDFDFAEQFITKAYQAKLFKSTAEEDLYNWFNHRFVPNLFLLDENDYIEASIQSLKIQFSVAGTDFGTSRQRDLGQKWSDTIRGYLGELGVKKILKERFKIDIKLGHELGTIEEYIKSDIREIKTFKDKFYRKPAINTSIKTTKANGVWLDIPGDQFSHSDVYILALIGVNVNHLFSYFKSISVFKDKVLKKGVDREYINQIEADEIFDKVPSFNKIYGYLPGIVSSSTDMSNYQGTLGETNNYKYEGKKPKTKYTITNWCGKYQQEYLESIKIVEDAKSIGFLGIDKFTQSNRYLFGLNSLKFEEQDWLEILVNKI